MTIKSLLAAAASMAVCAAALAAPINEDFNSCAGSCGATVTFAGAASASSVYVGSVASAINTQVIGGFDSFFASSFLVIGDDDGSNGLSGNPNGGGGADLSRASFNLGNLTAGSYSFQVQFDYKADTNSTTSAAGGPPVSPDVFKVLFETAPGALDLTSVLTVTPIYRNTEFGTVSQTFNVSLTSTSDVYLSFSVEEFSGNGSSAAGIDNLIVEQRQTQQVPEPGSLALAGLALLGLGALRRRR